jgi:hypothetical protein
VPGEPIREEHPNLHGRTRYTCRLVGECDFLLMKSYSHIGARAGFTVFDRRACRLYTGDHPRVRPLKEVEIGIRPLFTAFLPSASGVIDDHFEGWFVTHDEPPSTPLPGAAADRESSPLSG